jgi:polo-like kinase 4
LTFNQNYDIQNEVAQGEKSTVYLAVVKRGRLRNRKVALKKASASGIQIYVAPINLFLLPLQIPLSHRGSKSAMNVSTSLHLALHHPSIVSLLSTFSTATAYYHVLEFCSHGSLADFLCTRHPPMLSESELCGLLKSLVNALLYLHKEQVLHGNIKAENILITDDYRIVRTCITLISIWHY